MNTLRERFEIVRYKNTHRKAVNMDNTAVKQADVDYLRLQYIKKKREVERGLAEMRALRKQIDLYEDFMIIDVMKNRDAPSQKEILHG